jgi:uncharacterized membrane protein YraQ (UPF0718 family)
MEIALKLLNGGAGNLAAVAAGSLLAVCSCTIVPLFAGIYRKGAGIGPAITFLFFARRATSWHWPIPAAF